MAFTLSSPAFKNQNPIPRDFSGEGENLSPPLRWIDVPDGARELVLICEDLDASGKQPFVHWIMFHIPSHAAELPEGIPSEVHLVEPFESDQGRNSAGDIGYTGPMPPVGHGRHRYLFRLFALDQPLRLSGAVDKEKLLRAMKDHVIGVAELMGTYERKTGRRAA